MNVMVIKSVQRISYSSSNLPFLEQHSMMETDSASTKPVQQEKNRTTRLGEAVISLRRLRKHDCQSENLCGQWRQVDTAGTGSPWQCCEWPCKGLHPIQQVNNTSNPSNWHPTKHAPWSGHWDRLSQMPSERLLHPPRPSDGQARLLQAGVALQM
jgi:hypothetical protein